MVNRESLKKFAIESAAIISSILIAFSIDSYWDLHKQEQSRKTVISALEKDFEKTYQELENSITHKNNVVDTMAKIILLPEASVMALNVKESRKMINTLTTVYTYLPPTASVESLVSSGELNNISNQKLRESLASYRFELESLRRTQKWVLDTTNHRTIPFLAERIPMHLFSYNGPKIEGNVHNLDAKIPHDVTETFIVPLFSELEFRNLAQNRLLAVRLTILKLKVLQESVAEVCKVLKNTRCGGNT